MWENDFEVAHEMDPSQTTKSSHLLFLWGREEVFDTFSHMISYKKSALSPGFLDSNKFIRAIRSMTYIGRIFHLFSKCFFWGYLKWAKTHYSSIFFYECIGNIFECDCCHKNNDCYIYHSIWKFFQNQANVFAHSFSLSILLPRENMYISEAKVSVLILFI